VICSAIARQAGFLHGGPEGECRRHREDDLPLHAAPGLDGGTAAGEEHRPGREHRRFEHAEVGEARDQDHRDEDPDREVRAVVTDRRGPLDAADEVEMMRVPLLLGERRMRFQHQRIAGLQHDVADLGVDALAAAGHSDDDGVVERTKLPVPNGSPDDRAPVRDDGLDETPPRPRRVELEDLGGGRLQAPDLLEVDHRTDHADEHEPIVGVEHHVRRDGG
jgi:hypothetical protein